MAGNIPAKMLVRFPTSVTTITYSSNDLADELQKNINAGNARLQLKIYWASPTSDDDGNPDGLEYHNEGIFMIVQYI